MPIEKITASGSDIVARVRLFTLLVSVFLVAVLSVRCVRAQDAVPAEILSRTYEIKIGNGHGTVFAIERNNKIYFVTAGHVAKLLPRVNARLSLLVAGQWKDFQTTRTLFPASPKVDIAVFETGESAPRSFDITPMDGHEGPTFGQQVWFLGYPLLEGIHTHFTDIEVPFIKRGTLSAIDNSDPNAVLFYIDGFNNEGFSGGPIIYWDFDKHAYRILAVVMGYRNENALAEINGHQVPTPILINSGILVGYSIKHAIEAIDASQQHR